MCLLLHHQAIRPVTFSTGARRYSFNSWRSEDVFVPTEISRNSANISSFGEDVESKIPVV